MRSIYTYHVELIEVAFIEHFMRGSTVCIINSLKNMLYFANKGHLSIMDTFLGPNAHVL